MALWPDYDERINRMPDTKELLHSNLHEVFSERDLHADGRPSSEHIRKT